MNVLDGGLRVHRYSVNEVWGDAPAWLTAMVGDPDAFMLMEYRGGVTQQEVEKGGRILYGWAGDYKGVSDVAAAQLSKGPLPGFESLTQPAAGFGWH